MSNTYKTMPGWVKVLKPNKPSIVTENHDHRHGICDIHAAVGDKPFYWQRRYWNGAQFGYCGYDVSYYGYHGGFYARPRRGRSYRQEFEGKMRANWRKQRDEMLKLDREGIEDYDYHGQQHRHSALWEMY